MDLAPGTIDTDTRRFSMPRQPSQRQVRERLEREREQAISQLRDLGISPDASGEIPRGAGDHPRDEGDHAQLSERQDLSFMTRERLADRINRLTRALERLADGRYGTCDVCGGDIEAPRLRALPEAVTCLACQREQERAA
jgi:DnaK suppressor protein